MQKNLISLLVFNNYIIVFNHLKKLLAGILDSPEFGYSFMYFFCNSLSEDHYDIRGITSMRKKYFRELHEPILCKLDFEIQRIILLPFIFSITIPLQIIIVIHMDPD